eukprot:1391704-Amorphochlora_amoeboformis.AAC.1
MGGHQARAWHMTSSELLFRSGADSRPDSGKVALLLMALAASSGVSCADIEERSVRPEGKETGARELSGFQSLIECIPKPNLPEIVSLGWDNSLGL